MYSVIYIDNVVVVLPSEYVQPTNKVLAFGIVDKNRAYEIRDKIQTKYNNKEQKP